MQGEKWNFVMKYGLSFENAYRYRKPPQSGGLRLLSFEEIGDVGDV